MSNEKIKIEIHNQEFERELLAIAEEYGVSVQHVFDKFMQHVDDASITGLILDFVVAGYETENTNAEIPFQ